MPQYIAMNKRVKNLYPEELYVVGSEKQLFIDDAFFDVSENITLKLHLANKTGEKNLQSEYEWESATLNWFSIMEDGGKYRMWYEAYDVEGWPTADDTSFCYAESTDGIHWTKPKLNLYTYRGSAENNILFRLIGNGNFKSRVHGTGVFKDPAAPPESRYKAVSQGMFADFTPPYKIAGMYSPDGIHWTRYPQPICNVFADSQYSAFWDPQTEKYVLYGRVSGRGRSLGRSESGDFTRFDPLVLVLQTDENDPEDTDLYNPAAMKYPYAANVYLMFPSYFRHTDDTLEIRLAVSRDGTHWTWPERKAFIPLGENGEFDSGSLYMGQGIIRVGDELWQYYSDSPLKHEETVLENLKIPENRRFYSRVVSRLDGFVSADAGPEGGYFITPPLTYTGNVLKLNVEVRTDGCVRVGLLDEDGRPISGRSIADCVPMTGDYIDGLIRWNSGSDIGARPGRPIRMWVEMKNASLYAFTFTTEFISEEE